MRAQSPPALAGGWGEAHDGMHCTRSGPSSSSSEVSEELGDSSESPSGAPGSLRRCQGGGQRNRVNRLGEQQAKVGGHRGDPSTYPVMASLSQVVHKEPEHVAVKHVGVVEAVLIPLQLVLLDHLGPGKVQGVRGLWGTQPSDPPPPTHTLSESHLLEASQLSGILCCGRPNLDIVVEAAGGQDREVGMGLQAVHLRARGGGVTPSRAGGVTPAPTSSLVALQPITLASGWGLTQQHDRRWGALVGLREVAFPWDPPAQRGAASPSIPTLWLWEGGHTCHPLPP